MRLFRLFNLQKWDHDLANFATRFTTKCVFQHSDSYERKVAAPAFDAVGENLYLIGWTSKNFQKFVFDWGLREKYYYHFDSNFCSRRYGCFHYTQVGRLNINLTKHVIEICPLKQIIWADTDHVGLLAVEPLLVLLKDSLVLGFQDAQLLRVCL